jgi:hypothetical protein
MPSLAADLFTTARTLAAADRPAASAPPSAVAELGVVGQQKIAISKIMVEVQIHGFTFEKWVRD